MRKNKVVIVLVSLLISGCSASVRKATPFPQKVVAILPFENQTNNIEAGKLVRQALFEAMKQKNYRLVELSEIDSKLLELGITDGGQLGALTLKQMKEKISPSSADKPADIFCYGTVLEFGQKSAVAFTQRKVELKLKLVDARTEKVMFEGTETGITSRAGTDAAGDLVVHTAGKVVKSVKEGVKKILPGEKLKKGADLTDVIADVDLTAETQEAIRKLLEKFLK